MAGLKGISKNLYLVIPSRATDLLFAERAMRILRPQPAQNAVEGALEYQCIAGLLEVIQREFPQAG